MAPFKPYILLLIGIGLFHGKLSICYPADPNDATDIEPIDGLNAYKGAESPDGGSSSSDRQSFGVANPSALALIPSTRKDVVIDFPCNGNDDGVGLPRKACTPLRVKIADQLSWITLFLGLTSLAGIVGEGGLGAFKFHEPILAFEGLLTLAFVIAHCALIGTKVYLVDNTPWRWDPFAAVKLLEKSTVMAISTVIFFQMFLSILFDLGDGKDAVELITSMRDAAITHAAFGLDHILQGVVLEWRQLQEWTVKTYMLSLAFGQRRNLFLQKNKADADAYLAEKGWTANSGDMPLDANLKDAIQQHRDVLGCLGQATFDPTEGVDLDTCSAISRQKLESIVSFKHEHSHGMSAILADIAVHGFPTVILAVAAIMQSAGMRIDGHAVAWTVNMITLATLVVVMGKTGKDTIKVFQELGVQLSTTEATQLDQYIQENVVDEDVAFVRYSAFQVPAEKFDIKYISFFVEVYDDVWDDFFQPRSGVYRSKQIEEKLRRIAVKLKLYDGTKMNREFGDDERPTWVSFMPVKRQQTLPALAGRAKQSSIGELQTLSNTQFAVLSAQYLGPIRLATEAFDAVIQEEMNKLKITKSEL
ncbi:MAG: hypothetical protein M1825_002167 [Sarcosagium campestre]|nr:MAG: hypothetical protein M1825_002167 [Sarcosagium campestre]